MVTMLTYPFTVEAIKEREDEGLSWAVTVRRAVGDVPVAVWSPIEGLLPIGAKTKLIFEEDWPKVLGVGGKWHYSAYARREGREWRIFSEDHSATDALLRPALYQAAVAIGWRF